MPKKSTKKKPFSVYDVPKNLGPQFRAVVNDGAELARLVPLAMPVARLAVVQGHIDEPLELAADLLGELALEPNGSISWDEFCTRMHAAHALGIALSLLLQPKMFGIDGGAR